MGAFTEYVLALLVIFWFIPSSSYKLSIFREIKRQEWKYIINRYPHDAITISDTPLSVASQNTHKKVGFLTPT
jgi:hypothetical protein